MENLISFISLLINKDVNTHTELAFSSAQRARLISWCVQNNIKVDSNSFKGRFSLSQLNLGTNVSEFSKKEIIHRSSFGTPRIGIDIQSVEEFGAKQDLGNAESLANIFTKYELRYAESSHNYVETLVGLFSCKEALIKAGENFVSLLDLEVTHLENGAPVYPGYAISISHSGGFAIAVAAKF
jgi:phosphopantetheine--protein transferase-like protein